MNMQPSVTGMVIQPQERSEPFGLFDKEIAHQLSTKRFIARLMKNDGGIVIAEFNEVSRPELRTT